MTKPQIPDEKADMPADGRDKPLDSHVQALTQVYGQPKGPRAATMFRHKCEMPPSAQERDGFTGGPDAVGLGDIVGSGPEEWERKPTSENDNEEEGQPSEDSS